MTLAVSQPADSDEGGLTDPAEQRMGTDRGDPDTGDDGLADHEEAAGGTNPLSPDSDGDGVGDARDGAPSDAFQRAPASPTISASRDGSSIALARAAVVERLTLSETSVAGTVSGTRLRTHASDNQGEMICEVCNGGEPSTGQGFLDHRFIIDVAPGNVVELHDRGQRSRTGHGDDFRFEWSTDGTTFTPIPMASLPSRPGVGEAPGPLPATLRGPVTIRVVDTVHTAGSNPYDWVWIEWLAVRSTSF